MGDLTASQKKAIKDSWALVAQDMTGHGVGIFVKMFQQYPDWMNLFEDFKGKSLDELKGSKHLRAQASAVMFAMAQLVNALDDTEQLVRQCRKMGCVHRSRPGVTGEHFKKLEPILLGYLAEKLGGALTAEGKAAWQAFYSCFAGLVADGLKTGVYV